MNRAIVLFALLGLLFLFGSPRLAATTMVQETLSETLENGGWIVQYQSTTQPTWIPFFDLAAVEAGGNIVVGEVNDTVLVMRVNENGTILWQKQIPEITGYGAQVYALGQGEYIVAGKGSSQTPYRDVFVKIDELGTINWQRSYTTSGCSSHYYNLAAAGDGGFVVSGVCTRGLSIDTSGWLMRVSSSGTVIWSRSYGLDEFAWFGGIARQGEHFYVVGYDLNYDLLMLKVDGAGNVVWQHYYVTEYEQGGGAERILATEAGDLLVYVSTGSETTSETHVWVLKINTDGDLLWEVAYGDVVQQSLIAGDVVEMHHGGYLIPSWVNNGDREFMLTKISDDGEVVWNKTVSESMNPYRFYRLDRAPDGGYVGTGSVYLQNSSFLVKFDENGATGGCNALVDEPYVSAEIMATVTMATLGSETVETTTTFVPNRSEPAFLVPEAICGDFFIVSGTVRDAAGNPVPGVAVSAGTEVRGYSDEFGEYTLPIFNAGRYTLAPWAADTLFDPNRRVVQLEEETTGQDFTAFPVPEPFLTLPISYTERNSGSTDEWRYFQNAFLGRATSLFDHQNPDYGRNGEMIPYLGYSALSTEVCLLSSPSYKCYDGHPGIDFADVIANERAYPAAPGTVVPADTGWSCLGWTVTIDHGNGFQTKYGHLHEAPTVSGDVDVTTAIGIIGNTVDPRCGRTTGSHLHFELLFQGTSVDPSGWLDPHHPDPWAESAIGNRSVSLWKLPIPDARPWQFDGASGGTFSSQNVTIEIPGGAIDGEFELLMAEVPQGNPSGNLEPTGYSFLYELYTSSAAGALRTSEPVPATLTVHYEDEMLPEVAEDSLQLYWWNTSTATWEALPGTLDTEGNVLSASTIDTGHFAVLGDDLDTQGPAIGKPVFAPVAPAGTAIHVTAHIDDSGTGGHGVYSATLRYGYASPYDEFEVTGVTQASHGDGEWTFAIPAQDAVEAGNSLRFRLVAVDGDVTPATSIEDNAGAFYSVAIREAYSSWFVYLPSIRR